MKNLTGTVKTIRPPTVSLGVEKLPTIKRQNLKSILLNIRNDKGEILLKEWQTDNLLAIPVTDDSQMLSLQDRYFIYEVVNMINSLGYEETYNFLNKKWDEIIPAGSAKILRKKILLRSPLLEDAHEKQKLDMEIYRENIDVSKGAVDCPKCSSGETISVESQRRSADEPMTVHVTCIQCRHKWFAQ